MGDRLDRLNSLNQSLTNISMLESSDQIYGLNKIEGSDGVTTYDKETDQINIGYVNNANFVHEMTYASNLKREILDLVKVVVL